MMTIDEASRLIGVPTARLRSWVADGTSPDAVAVDGEPMFELDAVRGWIRALPTSEGVPQLPGYASAGHTLH